MALTSEVRIPAIIHLMDGTEVCDVDLVVPVYGDMGEITDGKAVLVNLRPDIQSMRVEPRN